MYYNPDPDDFPPPKSSLIAYLVGITIIVVLWFITQNWS